MKPAQYNEYLVIDLQQNYGVRSYNTEYAPVHPVVYGKFIITKNMYGMDFNG